MRPYEVSCRVPFIYGLVDPFESEHIRYVGLTTTDPRRPYSHLTSKEKTHKGNWIRSLVEEGRTYSVVILLELPVDASRHSVCKAEQEQIALLRSRGHRLTNATAGGDGLIDPSLEVRQQISVKMKGRVVLPDERARRKAAWTPELRAQVAKKTRAQMTPEECEKRRLAGLAQVQSKHTQKTKELIRELANRPEALAKSAWATGKKQSPETIAKRVLSTALTKYAKLAAELEQSTPTREAGGRA